MKKSSLLFILMISVTSCSSIGESIFPPQQDDGDSDVVINFTAINDFHGAVDDRGARVGINKLASYLKEKTAEGNVLINSGDLYQGSFVSGYTKGRAISEIFRDIGFDAYTIGNHEFDWGIESIENNSLYLGEKFLGCNVYKYPYNANNPEKSELFSDYKIIKVNEGTEDELKIGIIGGIGRDQITSICSTFTKNIVFLDLTDIVKDLSYKLKMEEGCDLVVGSFHTGSVSSSLTSYINGTNKRYLDAVFLAHTHKLNSSMSNGAPLMQAEAYGTYASNVSLKYNKLTGEVTCTSYKHEGLQYLNLKEDFNAKAILSSYRDGENGTDAISSKIVGYNETGHYLDLFDVSAFLEKAASKKAVELGYNFDYCMFNNSRTGLRSGEFSYGDLYETHPFLNSLYILNIDRKDLIDESSYCIPYRNTDVGTNSKSRFEVLVYDFNGLHIGINDNYEKYYNYFPSAFNSYAEHEPILVTDGNGLKINAFDAAIEYLNEFTYITSEDVGSGESYGIKY